MNIAGVILAGGLSRRMGGEEKSLISISGKPALTRIAKCLSGQVSHLAINANGDPSRFDFTGLPVLADTVDGFVGPLAGVLAAMRWANGLPGITHIITAAADTPFIPDNLVEQLSSACIDENDIVMASSNNRIHPVFAIWPIHLADQLERFLVEEDKRKILEFAERFNLKEVEFEIRNGDPFFNINTPRDLAIARKIIENKQEA